MKIQVSLIAAALLISTAVFADDHYVKPHTTKDGTYVEGHYQTNPNSTKNDNYSTKGNTNPYTGKEGTKDPNKPAKPKY